jgi:peptide/nickel transport system ATP-binding protein
MNTVLEINNLKTHFHLDEGLLKAVDGVTFSVKQGETLALIGESGCGKSVTARSILRLITPPGKIVDGQIFVRDARGHMVDTVKLPETGEDIRRIRGKQVAMIFQEPMTSLSPVHTIGSQIMEAALLHRTKDKREAREIARTTLAKVGMPEPERILDAYPHQLSGGLRQRAMIAMALTGQPSLLIADEPTTALDVTVQWQILKLLRDLKDEFGMAMLYITHDLGVVAQIADTMAVMYLGKIVEYGSVYDVFENPLHPYTRKLLKSAPLVGEKRKRLDAIRGNVPVPIHLPLECGFRSRCDDAFGRCSVAMPALKEKTPGHVVRCFLHHEIEEASQVSEVKTREVARV